MTAPAQTVLIDDRIADRNPVNSDRLQDGLSFLDRNIDSMVADLARLVGVDTSFPPGRNYDQFADLICDLCDDLGGTQEKVTVPTEFWRADGAEGERVNLIISPDVRAAGCPELQIYCHTDTAPIGDGWTKPPMAVTEDGDVIYGRGAADMKGAMIATITAIRALKSSGSPFHFQPKLLFCTDEEGGIYPGIRYLAEQGHVSGALLNLNGSAVPRIWAGCFGSIDLRMRFFGRGAHSGAPGDGVNAAEEALVPIAALMALKADVESRTSDMPPPPSDDGPLHSRLAITAIRGGEKGSAWPGELEIVVNRRYAPEEHVEAVIDELRRTVTDAVKETRLLDCAFEIVGHLPPVVDPDGPDTPRWTAAQAAGFDVPLADFHRFGSTTSSDFGWVQKAGIQHIMLGGLSRPGRNVHGPDEHTTRGDLLGLARSIFLFLAEGFDPDAGPLDVK